MPPLSNPASITSEVEDYEKANCGSTIYKSNSHHHTSSMIPTKRSTTTSISEQADNTLLVVQNPNITQIQKLG